MRPVATGDNPPRAVARFWPRNRHEPELVELTAQREEHGEPQVDREDVSLLRDVVRASARRSASRRPRPRNATAVGSSPKRRRRAPHSTTIPTKVPITSFSLKRSAAPAGRAPLCAAAGASGVTVTSGDMSLYSTQWQQKPSPPASAAKTPAATSRSRSRRRTARAISAPSGLAAIAVSHSADESAQARDPREHQKARRAFGETDRLAWRLLPRRAKKPSGNSTPARAVLLGNAGAMTPSTRNTL